MQTPQKVEAWIEARKKYHLSHTQVQMARELGMNPKKLGKIANHRQEPWKLPLPLFIEDLYERRFGRSRPARVIALEEKAREINSKEHSGQPPQRQMPRPVIPPEKDQQDDEVPF